jgi:CRP-like cAMP-binding protein
MHQAFFDFVSKHSSTPLSESDKEFFKKMLIPKKLRKRQYFLQEGEVCKYVAFIVKGAMRQYTVDEKGDIHIMRLYIENWWAGDRESHINLTPSIYNVDAWEDTEYLQVSRADFLSSMNKIPAIVEMTRILDERHAIFAQKRLQAQITMIAEDRYADFAKTYPEFIQRFPQHIIASYLGITTETLSRVRKQSSKK